MAEQKTFYDGRWHTKDDPAPQLDPTSRITQLEADLANARSQVGALQAAMTDAEDANVARFNTLEADVLQLKAAPSRVEMPYLAGRATPDPWDLDPQTMTDPDLANNGWTVQLQSPPFTALTRAGDVDFVNFALPGTYRSTLRNGMLIFQGPGAAHVQIHKLWPGGPATLRARISPSLLDAYNTFVSLFMSNAANVGQDAAASRLYFMGLDKASVQEVKNDGGDAWVTYEEFTVPAAEAASPILYMHHIASTQYSSQATDEHGRSIKHRFTVPRTLGLTNPTHAGVWIRHSTNAWAHIHSIRRQPLFEMP